MTFNIGDKFDGVYPPEAAVWCMDNNAYIGTDEDGKYVILENERPTQKELIKAYEDAVQAHLDATAQSRGYDSTYTCLSYLQSTDATWREEAGMFSRWRDAVWRKCHLVLNDYVAGVREAPTVEGLIAELPKIDW
jgi:hypothetical protein